MKSVSLVHLTLLVTANATRYGLFSTGDSSISACGLKVAPLNLTGANVSLVNQGVQAHGIHFLDPMDSGAGFAVDQKRRLAYVVGYNCNAAGAHVGGSKNMSLFGLSLDRDGVEVNLTIPLPYWDNLDDHHTTVHLLPNGDLAVAGIYNTGSQPRPLMGAVFTMTPSSGTVHQYHVLKQGWGEYIKGPSALDGGNNVMYLVSASLGSSNAVLKVDLGTGEQAILVPPAGFTIMSLAFDDAQGGWWGLASNSTQILVDGYYLVFYDAVKGAFSTPVDLGEQSCASVENPSDNWNLAASFEEADRSLVVMETCQPSSSEIDTNVAVVDVDAGKVIHHPLAGSIFAPGNLFGVST